MCGKVEAPLAKMVIGHIGDRRVRYQWSIDHIGDCVGNLDDGFQQNNLIEIVNIYLIRPCAAKLIEII